MPVARSRSVAPVASVTGPPDLVPVHKRMHQTRGGLGSDHDRHLDFVV